MCILRSLWELPIWERPKIERTTRQALSFPGDYEVPVQDHQVPEHRGYRGQRRGQRQLEGVRRPPVAGEGGEVEDWWPWRVPDEQEVNKVGAATMMVLTVHTFTVWKSSPACDFINATLSRKLNSIKLKNPHSRFLLRKVKHTLAWHASFHVIKENLSKQFQRLNVLTPITLLPICQHETKLTGAHYQQFAIADYWPLLKLFWIQVSIVSHFSWNFLNSIFAWKILSSWISRENQLRCFFDQSDAD